MRVSTRSKLLLDYEKLSQAYKHVFNSDSPVVQEVIDDLVKFCRAKSSEFHINDRAHALLSGRRDVWLRIEQMVQLSPEQILEINSRPLETNPENLNEGNPHA